MGLRCGMDGEFTVVTKGSKRCARPKKGNGPSYTPSSSAAIDADAFEVEDVLRGVTDAAVSLRGAAWVKSVCDIVNRHSAAIAKEQPARVSPDQDPLASADTGSAAAANGWLQDIVCYGFGHIGGNRTAQLQAAMAVVLKEELGIKGDMQLFDPVLTDKEKEGARRLGFTVVEVNEVGLHAVAVPTLFFMPHCGRRLYSNVLRANWGLASLPRVLFIGNSFSSYRLRPLSGPAARSCLIAHLDEHVREEPLPPAPQEQHSFADTGVHSFPTELLVAAAGARGGVGAWEQLEPDSGGDDHGWC